MSNVKITPKQFNKITLAIQFGEYLYSRLPKVYRDYDVKIERKNAETQQIETFRTLEEYLKSFALGGFQPLLEDLEAIINLVDPLKCPAQFLPYLLRHFGLDYIDDIPEKFQRRLVQNVVTLYKKKGTIPAVAFLARELSGFGVTIEEKSDGTIEFALVKLNAYEDEDAELLLAQDVVQRYIHLFLPARASSKIIVVYGFTENVHINAPKKAKEDGFDHAYYNVDEVVGTITIDENGYKDVDGGYSESFNYLNHVVEKDFESLKLQLEEETHNFQPSIPDLTSLTNLVENDGLPVFTNGISCEDEVSDVYNSDSSGEVSINPLNGKYTLKDFSIHGGNHTGTLPTAVLDEGIYKLGDVICIMDDGKPYYITLRFPLRSTPEYPTYFRLDKQAGKVEIYTHYRHRNPQPFSVAKFVTGYKSVAIIDNFYSLDDGCFTQVESLIKVHSNLIEDPIGYYGTGTEGEDSKYYYYIVNGVPYFYHKNKTPAQTAQAISKGFFFWYLPKPWGYPMYTLYIHNNSYNNAVKLTLNTLTELSYDEYGEMSSPRVQMCDRKVGIVFDCNGAITEFELPRPIRLYSYGDKSDYIERVGDEYYIHHWFDLASLYDIDFNTFTVKISYRMKDAYTPANSTNEEIASHWFLNGLPSSSLQGRSLTGWKSIPKLTVVACTDKTITFDCEGYSDGNYFLAPHLPDSFGSDTVKYYADGVRSIYRYRNFVSFYADNSFEPGADSNSSFMVYEHKNSPRVEKITDTDVINKLNLLSIPNNCGRIYSKGIPFKSIEMEIKNKSYY